MQLMGAGILQMVTPPDVLTKYAGSRLYVHHCHPREEWLLDWRNGKKTTNKNGLHYLLSL